MVRTGRWGIGWLALVLLCSTLARAEAQFAVAGKTKTASAIASESAGASFWAAYGQECPTWFTQGLRLSEESPTENGIMPKDRLAALRGLEICIARAKANLISQAQTTEDLLAAESVANLWSTQMAVAKETEAAAADFLGISFGVGVGVSNSEDDVIPEAELGPGNVIVATKDDTALPRVIFESHYYGWCRSKACRKGTRGIGPYFGIVAKSDKLISAFSAGVMFGWKDPTAGDHQGFSVGFGALLDDDVKSLAKGFEEGKPLPPGEAQIRFEEKSRWSAILFFTRTF